MKHQIGNSFILSPNPFIDDLKSQCVFAYYGVHFLIVKMDQKALLSILSVGSFMIPPSQYCARPISWGRSYFHMKYVSALSYRGCHNAHARLRHWPTARNMEFIRAGIAPGISSAGGGCNNRRGLHHKIDYSI